MCTGCYRYGFNGIHMIHRKSEKRLTDLRILKRYINTIGNNKFMWWLQWFVKQGCRTNFSQPLLVTLHSSGAQTPTVSKCQSNWNAQVCLGPFGSKLCLMPLWSGQTFVPYPKPFQHLPIAPRTHRTAARQCCWKNDQYIKKQNWRNSFKSVWILQI